VYASAKDGNNLLRHFRAVSSSRHKSFPRRLFGEHLLDAAERLPCSFFVLDQAETDVGVAVVAVDCTVNLIAPLRGAVAILPFWFRRAQERAFVRRGELRLLLGYFPAVPAGRLPRAARLVQEWANSRFPAAAGNDRKKSKNKGKSNSNGNRRFSGSVSRLMPREMQVLRLRSPRRPPLRMTAWLEG
jgi:hypothetical protein